MISHAQPTRNRILIATGVLLWALVGMTLFAQGYKSAIRIGIERAISIPQARASIGTTTCGTYTNTANCGGVDCGINIPFSDQGQLDPDCSPSSTGNNVCDGGAYPNCFCQQTSGGNCGAIQNHCAYQPSRACTSDGDCQAGDYCMSAPKPPTVALVDQGTTWSAAFSWWTNQITHDNCVLYSRQDNVQTPRPWECIWGDGTDPQCSGAVSIFCTGDGVYEHRVFRNLPTGYDWYYGLRSWDTGIPPELHSEVRHFRTYTQDFSIDVAPPANTKIVTGEQTDFYTVTVTPIGGATGNVTLSIDSWNPSIAGAQVDWPDGTTVDLGNPQPKRFRIRTDDGTPPGSPVTQANIYSFRVKGSHASIGDRFKDMPQGLTVMDFTMTPSVTQITMNPTGDTKTFDVNFGWLPAGWMYDRTVALTNNAITGITVSYSKTSVTKNDASSTVTLTTNGAAPGPHTLTVTGTGNPGGLFRQATIVVNINTPPPDPDFTVSAVNGTQNVVQGGTKDNTIIVTSLNGFIEPVSLSGRATQQGHATGESSITFRFNPSQPQPPANGTVNSTVTLSTDASTPCLPDPGQLYSVTIEGRDNTQVGPPDSVRSGNYNLYVICAAQPAITMSVLPDSQSVTQGDAATYHVTVTSVNGFDGTVDLSLAAGFGCPTGSTCTYPPSVDVTPSTPGRFDFVADTDISTPTGLYQMKLNGAAQGDPTINASVQMGLQVNAAPDYTFTVTPQTLSLSVGGSGAYTVTITPSGGFAAPVKISWNMNPANPLVGFAPTSGNLIVNPGDSDPITVTANTGSIGTYTLDFTAIPQGGVGATKNVNGIALSIQNAICNGNCQSICVDGGNQPLVPEQVCTADSDCPTNYRCASQTCRGDQGCQPDPLPGQLDCNKDSCYDHNGTFTIPPTDPTCYQSWPRCKTYDVLKVRKDRQCNQWLSCEDSATYTDPTTKKEVTQCLNLGVCNQLGPSGECANFISPTTPKANLSFLSPLDVTGPASQIKNYSGYSSGFHFSGAKACAQARSTSCQTDADCGANGPCEAIIESTYPSQSIEETGLDGATGQDLVTNGTFEELRCSGGPRDGLSCILPSDCRVGQGVCADQPEPFQVHTVSQTTCTKDSDCSGTATPHCRYLVTSSIDVTCQNPVLSSWLGVTPPTGNQIEAGYEDTTNGVRQSQAGDALVRVMIREDDANIKNLSESDTAGAIYPDAQHPSRNGISEEHLKEGNNYLRATVTKAGAQFSGVGVPLGQSVVENGVGYVLTFKFRYENGTDQREPIKAQLAFNYDNTTGGYQNTNFVGFDFPIVQDAKVCQNDQKTQCSSDSDCTGTGPCVGQVEIPGTTDWQTFVLGPIIPSGFNSDETAFLNFVTNRDHNYDTSTVFDIDDVSLKPVLDVAQTHLTATDTKKLERRCRLFPRNDSPECNYLDENGTQYKGWKGYCMDKDPQNKDLCLTWWPLDLLAGETPFTVNTTTGYNDRSPLYFCMQQEGGSLYADVLKRSNSGIQNAHTETFDTSDFGTSIRWRDIERIQILSDVDDDRFDGNPGPAAVYNADVYPYRSNGSIFNMTMYENVDPAGNWGFSMYCLDHPDECLNKYHQGTGGVFSDTCHSHTAKTYVAAAVNISNPTNPDDPNAKLSSIVVHYCMDDGSGNQFQFENPINTRVLVYLRASCNALVRVVKSPAESKENKAWTVRTDPTSTYTVPDLGYGYSSDKAPFGALVAPANTPPDQWGGLPNGWGNDPLQLDVLSSEEPASNGRAGTPYSCKGDCGTNTVNSKYCYSPELPPTTQNGGYAHALGSTGTENRCSDRASIGQCLNSTSNGSSYCVGRPLGRCTGNQLLPCSSDTECSLANAGTCSDASVGSNQANLTFAADHLKRLFAKSYGCWELKSHVVDVPLLPPLSGVRKVWYEQYVSGCNDILPGDGWDIMSDGPGGTPLYCSGNVRRDYPNDYCAVRPTIDRSSFLINGAQSGNTDVPINQRIHGKFSYVINDQQQPLSGYAIVWDWNGSGSAEAQCNSASYENLSDTGKVDLTHVYDQAGTFHPVACVKDNWGAVGFLAFPGTVTVQ